MKQKLSLTELEVSSFTTTVADSKIQGGMSALLTPLTSYGPDTVTYTTTTSIETGNTISDTIGT